MALLVWQVCSRPCHRVCTFKSQSLKVASEPSSVTEPSEPILRQRLKWRRAATRDPNRLVLDCGQMAAAQARTLSRPCFTAACSASSGAAYMMDVQCGDLEKNYCGPQSAPRPRHVESLQLYMQSPLHTRSQQSSALDVWCCMRHISEKGSSLQTGQQNSPAQSG